MTLNFVIVIVIVMQVLKMTSCTQTESNPLREMESWDALTELALSYDDPRVALSRNDNCFLSLRHSTLQRLSLKGLLPSHSNKQETAPSICTMLQPCQVEPVNADLASLIHAAADSVVSLEIDLRALNLQREPYAFQVQNALSALLLSHTQLTSLQLSHVPVVEETEVLHIDWGMDCNMHALRTLRRLDLNDVQAYIIDVSGCSQLTELKVRSGGMYDTQFALPQSLQALHLDEMYSTFPLQLGRATNMPLRNLTRLTELWIRIRGGSSAATVPLDPAMVIRMLPPSITKMTLPTLFRPIIRADLRHLTRLTRLGTHEFDGMDDRALDKSDHYIAALVQSRTNVMPLCLTANVQ